MSELPEKCCGRCQMYVAGFCEWMVQHMTPDWARWLLIARAPSDGTDCEAFQKQQEQQSDD